MVLAVVMAVMAMPMSAFAAVASDLPEEMVDHSILRALAYTGYDVEQQIADGTLYQSGSYGSRTPSDVLSGINYGTSTSGFETVADASTVTGLAPNIARYQDYGLCCASFVTYYICNYLPNIEGVDTEFITNAIKSTGMNSQAVVTWQTALNWSEVETAMTNAGYDTLRIQEAQTLYVFALYDYADESGFANKIVGCFAADQTDAELIANVNSVFGTDIVVDDFTNAMASTRNAYINTSNYTDPTTKNNLDLVKWCEFAADKGWGYVYGTYGTVLDESFLESKITQYPDEVGGKEEFIRANWLGKRTADCVGLIKGYSWYDVAGQTTILVSNDMPDIGADTMYENATEKGTIDTIPEVLGLAVWKEGHIGVYIGNGQVVEAYGTTTGVIRSQLADGGWTHWLKIPYITYLEVEVENS